MRRIAVALIAIALAAPASASASHVYVSNDDDSTLSAFSTGVTGALSPIGCPVAGTCNQGTSPRGVAMTPSGHFLYTADFTDGVVTASSIDPSGAPVTFLCLPGCQTGGSPRGVAVTPDGKYLYAANSASSSVTAFSVADNGAPTAISCVGCGTGAGTFPRGVAITPNGQFLYVSNAGTSTISQFQVNGDGTLTVIGCPVAGCNATTTTPDGLAITPNGQFLYVANGGGNAVSVFSIATGTGSLSPVTCATCGTGAGSTPLGVAITPNGRFLYIADSSGLSPFSINSNGTLTPIACGTSCNLSGAIAVAVDPGSHFVYAATQSGPPRPFAINAAGSLTSISCAGCGASHTHEQQSVVVSPDQAPTAAFSANPGVAGTSSTFDGSASTAFAGQSVARYDWSFGDGTTAPNGGPTPSHTYAVPGTYTTTLTVTDNAGCSTSRTYTGQTVSCNGAAGAHKVQQITIAPSHTLTAAVLGHGSGTVKGIGINCPGDCTGTYAVGTAVTLTATPAASSTFAGWGGDCSGSGSCKVTMGADHNVSATFNKAKAPNTKISKAKINSKEGTATFSFKSVGRASGFQCALVKKRKQAKFKKCSSPKTYKKLKGGKYTFEVRALGKGGKDASPAKKKFKIS